LLYVGLETVGLRILYETFVPFYLVAFLDLQIFFFRVVIVFQQVFMFFNYIAQNEIQEHYNSLFGLGRSYTAGISLVPELLSTRITVYWGQLEAISHLKY
jgi:hypothetical protein